jgi:hypothetical protein
MDDTRSSAPVRNSRLLSAEEQACPYTTYTCANLRARPLSAGHLAQLLGGAACSVCQVRAEDDATHLGGVYGPKRAGGPARAEPWAGGGRPAARPTQHLSNTCATRCARRAAASVLRGVTSGGDGGRPVARAPVRTPGDERSLRARFAALAPPRRLLERDLGEEYEGVGEGGGADAAYGALIAPAAS